MRRDLGTEKRELEDSVAEIIVIGGQMEILKEIVGQSLCDVCSVEFQSHEHDAGKYHYPSIDLPDQLVLFAPGPSSGRVEAMQVLPTGWLI